MYDMSKIKIGTCNRLNKQFRTQSLRNGIADDSVFVPSGSVLATSSCKGF